eukprot:1155740-Pelagomonas_calceolata.AAC.6
MVITETRHFFEKSHNRAGNFMLQHLENLWRCRQLPSLAQFKLSENPNEACERQMHTQRRCYDGMLVRVPGMMRVISTKPTLSSSRSRPLYTCERQCLSCMREKEARTVQRA